MGGSWDISGINGDTLTSWYGASNSRINCTTQTTTYNMGFRVTIY